MLYAPTGVQNTLAESNHRARVCVKIPALVLFYTNVLRLLDREVVHALLSEKFQPSYWRRHRNLDRQTFCTTRLLLSSNNSENRLCILTKI